MTLVFRSETSSALIPIIFTPLLRYFASIATNSGYSATQGPHQVAQKLITSSCPLSESLNLAKSAGLSKATLGPVPESVDFPATACFAAGFFCWMRELTKG